MRNEERRALMRASANNLRSAAEELIARVDGPTPINETVWLNFGDALLKAGEIHLTQWREAARDTNVALDALLASG